MRYGKMFVCILTALFLAVAGFFWLKEPAAEVEVPLSITVLSQDGAEQITCWKNDSGEYFLFLPGYAELSGVRISVEKDHVLQINGQPLVNGMSCDAFALDVPYDLSYTLKDQIHHFRLTFVRSANIPALYIDVRSGSMDYIHREKGNKESGTLRLYTAGGALDHAGNLKSLGGHGNSTWEMDKKPYNLELSGEGDLLGMGQAQNWILLANAYDPSHLRNKIAYDFAGAAGLSYSPDCEWVDLYLNGEYAGLYLLSERNEVHPQRVALSGDDSFLVSKEWEWRMTEQEQPFIMLDSRASLRIHSSALDSDALTALWQSAENAILADDGIDPVTGKSLTELIDLDSWAKKYLMEEVFGNVDAATLSQYFYYDGSDTSGKIHAGPVWDYDLSMGNTVAWPLHAPNMIFAGKPDIYASPWFHALSQKSVFYDRLVQLYQTDFLPLLEDLLESGIDQYTAQVAQAAAMNQVRWDEKDPAAEIEGLQTYMTERVAFLNSMWIDGAQYCIVQIDNGESNMCYAVLPGDALPPLPQPEVPETDALCGWYEVTTDQPFDITQPVYEDTQIYWKQPSTTEAQDAESSEQPSLLRLGPAMVFVGMLCLVCFWDRKQSRPADHPHV